MMARRHLAALLALGAALYSVAAQAQPYPSRPVTMVVPYAAGGAFDVLARIVGARMGELLGQSVIVENVTGAAGIIGVQHVINAKPDGYTVLLGTVGTHAYNQTMYRKRRYDAVNDFTPVTLFSDQPMVLEGRKDLPANNLTEFTALLKQNGTKMQYGSAGAGSTTHLACALLNARIGVDVTHVPYRGVIRS
jgi:tripartite-type tricarboxylate transporter receptor subunit TctC